MPDLSSLVSANTTAVAAAGANVLQVVTSNYTGYTAVSSNTFADIPLSVDITLTSSSNRVMVWAMCGALEPNNSSNGGMAARLIRKIGSGSDTTLSEGNAQQSFNSMGGSSNTGVPLSLAGGDAPATSSAVTYKVQVKEDNGNTIRVNYYGDADMTIIAMEIKV